MIKRKSANDVKVSIIMCTHNGARYIEEQLTSLLNQTYPIYELIIFDDASTDETVTIIKDIIYPYTFCKLQINQQNIGFNRNFELALKACTGDVIAFSDQDDIWLEKKIEIMVENWLVCYPAIYCNSYLFKENIPNHISPNKRINKFSGNDARKIFLSNTVSGHALMIRKDFLQKIFPFQEGVMYDWWIAVVASYNGGLQFVNEVLVYHRGHDNNISIDYTKRSLRDNIIRHKKEAIKHCVAFANAPNIPEAHKMYVQHFAQLLKASLYQKFSFQLFLFIFHHRGLMFNNRKKKALSVLSYLKHSYRFALGAKNL